MKGEANLRQNKMGEEGWGKWQVRKDMEITDFSLWVTVNHKTYCVGKKRNGQVCVGEMTLTEVRKTTVKGEKTIRRRRQLSRSD